MSQLDVALIQSELAWESPEVNIAHFDLLLDGLNSDLIVLPEMFSTGFSMSSSRLAEPMDGPTIQWMTLKAGLMDATVCGSLIIEDQGKHFNRFIWASPDGEIQHYDKRHLFRMSSENNHYTPGTDRLVIEINGFRVCPQVCYDLRFPVWSRNTESYDLLIYVANWPAARREHWCSLLKARAIENLSYVVGVNRIGVDGNDVDYAGDSVAHDFNGQPLLEMASDERAAIVSLDKELLDGYRRGFPAHLDSDNYRIIS